MKNTLRLLSNRYFIFSLIIVIALYWKWWLPGPRVANDFPIISLQDLKAQFDIPQAWFLRGSIGLGGYSVFTLWSWLIDFIAGFFANLGLGISVLERLMLVIPTIFIGVFSIWKLPEELKLSNISKVVVSLFYLSNTYILLLIDGGQLSIALALASFPTAYLLFLHSVEGGLRERILAGLSFWVLGILDLRFIYVLLILLAIKFFYESIYIKRSKWTLWILKWLKSGLIVSLMFIALNAFWIVPLVRYPLSDTRISDLTKISNLNFTQFKHSIALLQPHWYENVFGRISDFRKEFLLIPVLAFLAIILQRKNRQVWFWSIVAVISTFLAKGANPPFPEVYPWLFTHVPGFSLFRDSSKFFFLIVLSYSVLIAFTIDSIMKKFPKFKMLFPGLLIVYFLFLTSPVVMGKMTGTFSKPRYEKDYEAISKIIEEDKAFGRVFWIPSRTPLGYSSRLHSSLEASRIEALRPFAISTVGTYETQNFIRESNYMGELFNIMGIKYVTYPYFDPRRDDMSQEKVEYYNSFLSQIAGLPWISEQISNSPVPVFKTKENQDKFFLSQNTYFIVGSDRIYSDIKNLGGSFNDNALVFTEENPELLNQTETTPGVKILLYDKNITDLLVSFAKRDEFISPSLNLDNSPNKSGWWKRDAADLVWLRDFLQTKYGIDNLDFDYGSGYAIGEGERELEVRSSLFTKGKILFARVMQSSKSGKMEFFQNEKLIGGVDTKLEDLQQVTIKLTGNEKIPDKFYKYDKGDFHWIRIGEIPDDGNLVIKTKGDINIINSLVVTPDAREAELNQKVETLRTEERIIEWSKLNINERRKLFAGENKASISYEIISPTHYKIDVDGLEAGTTLFFSDIFDNGWELDSQSGYKLYSLINGFWVDKSGQYDLYFTPQRYVIPGLIVSLFVLTSSIMFVVWRKSKKSS